MKTYIIILLFSTFMLTHISLAVPKDSNFKNLAVLVTPDFDPDLFLDIDFVREHASHTVLASKYRNFFYENEIEAASLELSGQWQERMKNIISVYKPDNLVFIFFGHGNEDGNYQCGTNKFIDPQSFLNAALDQAEKASYKPSRVTILSGFCFGFKWTEYIKQQEKSKERQYDFVLLNASNKGIAGFNLKGDAIDLDSMLKNILKTLGEDLNISIRCLYEKISSQVATHDSKTMNVETIPKSLLQKGLFEE